jgi:rubrerythrin
MDNLSKKVSYLKGYADGLNFSPESNEGLIIAKMLEVLEEMAEVIDDLEYAQEETDEIIEELDEAVLTMADDLYGDDYEELDDEEDYDDFLDDYEDDEYDEDGGDYFEIQCPSCGEDVMVDFDMIDGDNAIVCPNCHEEIELELEFDCDDDDCDCGHHHN